MAKPYRIFVVDDHPLIVSGIRLLMEQEGDLELVGTADDGARAQRQCIHLQPDLLILDLQIPGKSPIEIINALHDASPRTKILVMSAFQDRAYIKNLQQAGIEGYILKDEAHEMLLTAARTVLRNATWFSQPVFEVLVAPTPPTTGQLLWETLTAQEQSILLGIGRGLNNKQIAQELYLAEQTVRNYSSHLYEKLGIASRAQVVVWLRNQHIPIPTMRFQSYS
jgi:DNA-binding NarL/FixJ family response regulator